MASVDRRLTELGVPAAFHAELTTRRAPRFHTFLHYPRFIGGHGRGDVGMVEVR
jgi:hypothetical protein